MSIATPFGAYRPPVPGSHATDHTPLPPDDFLIPPRGGASAATARILIVDEDPIVCARMGSLLSRQGYSIAVACTHAMADAMRRAVSFDLVVSKIRPSDPTSREWIERLLVNSPVPVILTSAEPAPDGLAQIAGQPLGGFLMMPVDPTALEQLVARRLRPPAS